MLINGLKFFKGQMMVKLSFSGVEYGLSDLCRLNCVLLQIDRILPSLILPFWSTVLKHHFDCFFFRALPLISCRSML